MRSWKADTGSLLLCVASDHTHTHTHADTHTQTDTLSHTHTHTLSHTLRQTHTLHGTHTHRPGPSVYVIKFYLDNTDSYESSVMTT